MGSRSSRGCSGQRLWAEAPGKALAGDPGTPGNALGRASRRNRDSRGCSARRLQEIQGMLWAGIPGTPKEGKEGVAREREGRREGRRSPPPGQSPSPLSPSPVWSQPGLTMGSKPLCAPAAAELHFRLGSFKASLAKLRLTFAFPGTASFSLAAGSWHPQPAGNGREGAGNGSVGMGSVGFPLCAQWDHRNTRGAASPSPPWVPS